MGTGSGSTADPEGTDLSAGPDPVGAEDPMDPAELAAGESGAGDPTGRPVSVGEEGAGVEDPDEWSPVAAGDPGVVDVAVGDA